MNQKTRPTPESAGLETQLNNRAFVLLARFRMLRHANHGPEDPDNQSLKYRPHKQVGLPPYSIQASSGSFVKHEERLVPDKLHEAAAPIQTIPEPIPENIPGHIPGELSTSVPNPIVQSDEITTAVERGETALGDNNRPQVPSNRHSKTSRRSRGASARELVEEAKPQKKSRKMINVDTLLTWWELAGDRAPEPPKIDPGQLNVADIYMYTHKPRGPAVLHFWVVVQDSKGVRSWQKTELCAEHPIDPKRRLKLQGSGKPYWTTLGTIQNHPKTFSFE
ncbi:hypothetical protein SISNIDRAFT_471592 [Sistotremastrum niveocremeum HHB9708]|uniref:Uncharacterized protein n=1 Tax=Sistotremastrum niveocremeum HHB9708 TaxID=1314777 RepID=A0A164MFJ1_9AGAM|nr:hypothetical protein SISNIDRAFT_471592 [Sistotremastrum niveocremeum HHB9708]